MSLSFSISAIVISLMLALIASLLFLIECRKNPPFIFLSVLFFSAVTKFISVAFLDYNPIFMSETGMTSFYTGIVYRFLFFHLLIFLPAAFVSRIYCRKNLSRKYNTYYIIPRLPSHGDFKLVVIILSVILLIQTVNFALSTGLPLFDDSVTRWSYWEKYAAIKILPKLFGKLMIFYPFLLGILLFVVHFSQDKKNKIIVCLLIVGYYIYLIMIGQKVNGLIVPTAYLLASYSSCKGFAVRKIEIGRIIKIALFSMLCVSIIGYYAVQGRGITEMAGGGILTFLYRVFVLTGSSYWTVDYYVFMQGYSGTLTDLYDGMSTLIALIMPDSLAESYLEKGVNLSGGMPAMAVYAAGNVFGGALISVAYGLFLGGIIVTIHKFTIECKLITIFFVSYLVLWSVSCYSLASFGQILHVKFLLFFLAPIFLANFRNKSRVN